MSDINIEKINGIDIKLKYNEVVDEYSELCCSKIQNKSPKGFRGKYARGWRTEVDKTYGGGYGVVVYNATDWQLTHLLENGHIIANKKDGTGWASAKPHINPAYRSVKNKFIKAMENVDYDMKFK